VLTKPQWIDLLAVLLQGPFSDGAYHTEYDDRGPYAEHLLGIPAEAELFVVNAIALCGGYARKAIRVSESKSNYEWLEEIGVWSKLPSTVEATLIEDRSLDTAENVLMALLVARRRFPDRPFGRIIVSTAMEVKTARLCYITSAMGSLRQRIFVVGRMPLTRFADPDGALAGERAVVAKMKQDRDPLMQDYDWRSKRAARCDDPRGFAGRFDADLRADFPQLFAALDQMAEAGTSNGPLVERFKAALETEVVAPRPGLRAE
jgi:hypothetical protein